ncbi:DUF4180 domain-containing protein [Oscillibacter sp.]|uniref:DUF4180 domain-containing protein n=1 Tax=Oscillibacter sp. TaxID=1945593 RepID=UPI00338FAFFE
MNIETIQAPRGAIAVLSGGKVQITDAGAALDLAMSVRYETGASRLAIDKRLVCSDFFILSTGVAGDILQKLMNYRFKAAIYGDYSHYASKPLRTLSASPIMAKTSFSCPPWRRPSSG